MPYIILIGAVLSGASASVLGGAYNRVTVDKKDASALYSLIATCCAFIFWLIMFLFDFTFDLRVLWYSLIFGACYAVVNICFIWALKTGPVVLSSLFSQLSLVGVTVWGFIFWGSKLSLLVIIGLLLVVLSTWLCLYDKKDNDDKKFNLKWLFFISLVFLGTAGCAIVQKTQQIDFNGQYGNFFMVGAVFISVLVCLALYIKSNKKDSLVLLKKNCYLPVVAGALNGLHNLCVILLATTSISPSLIYPVIGVGGLIIVTLCSCLIFKEKLKWWQWVGMAIGMIATGVLSI